MPPKKGRSDPRKQYFDAIRTGKMDTLRWCLRHGGISVRAEDDDGRTGLQLAAAGGFAEALQTLIESVRKAGQPSDLEEVDDDGRTPLMIAAHAGKLECVRLLVLEGKVKLNAKCEHGKTAKAYAAERKHDKIVAFLDNPTAPPEEEEDEEDEEDEAEKAKRVFKASQRAAGQATAAAQQEAVHRQRVEAAEALERALASSAAPVWAEVKPILKETRRELSLKNKPPLTDHPSGSVVDPTVWNCVCLFELRLEIADRALTSLPPQLSRLSELVTLIVSNNALASLPDEIGTLTKLRNLEAANNELKALPSAVAQLTGLQVIDVSANQLTDVQPLSKLTSLVAVNAGQNQIGELPLSWDSLEHMQTLACPSNLLTVMPAGIGNLQMLVSLDLSQNQIEQVPIELGQLTIKKLQAVKLQGNPLADARIRRFVEEDKPDLVKDLLNHVRKNGFKGEQAAGGGKKGGKKGKGKGKGGAAAKAQEASDDEGDADASIAELLAAMGGGSDSDDDGKVNVS